MDGISGEVRFSEVHEPDPRRGDFRRRFMGNENSRPGRNRAARLGSFKRSGGPASMLTHHLQVTELDQARVFFPDHAGIAGNRGRPGGLCIWRVPARDSRAARPSGGRCRTGGNAPDDKVGRGARPSLAGSFELLRVGVFSIGMAPSRCCGRSPLGRRRGFPSVIVVGLAHDGSAAAAGRAVRQARGGDES